MKYIIVLFLFFTSFAYADTTAQEDAVQQLVTRLETRDHTIQQLQDANLDLLITNIELKRDNKSLLAKNKKLVSANHLLKQQLEKKVSPNAAYREAMQQIQRISNAFK